MSIGHKDSDNVIRDNTIVGNKRGGVYWRRESEPMAAHRVVFEKNTVRDNDGWGLFIDGNTNDTVIRQNTIEDSGTGRQTTAIRIGERAGMLTLDGNQIKAERAVVDERSSAATR
jgi:parallel beta-helix repeat protein